MGSSPCSTVARAREDLLNPTSIPSTHYWNHGEHSPVFSSDGLVRATRFVRDTLHVIHNERDGTMGVARGGALQPTPTPHTVVGSLPPLFPEWLGDRSFLQTHGLRFPYVAGAMANGIATPELVVAMGRAGMLGFFGAAGLSTQRIEQALDTIEGALGGTGAAWGSNLIHAPNEPHQERDTVALYLKRGVPRVSASAYMQLTPMVVWYAFSGVRQLTDGTIHRPHHVFAKVSRPEVAKRFLSPPPQGILDGLVSDGLLSAEEAVVARRLPVAEDLIVESDSGGHTDNQTLGALFPSIVRLRDQLVSEHGYARPIRVGAAGGIGTPSAAAAAFALGAAFIVTGSINQATLESGLSNEGKQLLAEADLSDVVMAPAADMFELGVKVQVLSRGTLFAIRAQQLYDLYRTHEGLDDLAPDDRRRLEESVLKMSVDEVWKKTHDFFSTRDPREIERAEADPKHKMALTFRWYLGLSSRWAIQGETSRRPDYQIWCGPAMGAFNRWVKGSFLEPLESRSAVQVALNLLEGASVVTRAQMLRTAGVPIPPRAFEPQPRPLA